MSERTSNEVRIDTAIKTDPRPAIAGQIRGGIRIRVGSERVIAYRNEDRYEWRKWAPEYTGDYLSAEFTNLFNTLLTVGSNSTDLYETKEMRFEATTLYLAFERLSDGYVRIAFRIHPQQSGENELHPTLESERGYGVDFSTPCQEAVECGEEFVEAANEFGHDMETAPIPQIEGLLDRLQTV